MSKKEPTTAQQLVEAVKTEKSEEAKAKPKDENSQSKKKKEEQSSKVKHSHSVSFSFNQKMMRQIILLLALGMFFYWLAQNVQIVPKVITGFLNLTAPVVYGIFLAIIINIPTRAIEEKLFGKPWKKHDFIRKKIKRTVSIFISLVFFFGLIGGFIVLVIPEIERTMSSFSAQLPRFLDEGGEYLEEIITNKPDLKAVLDNLGFDYRESADRIVSWFTKWSSKFMKSTLSFSVSIINSFVTFFLSLIFALYAVGQKEKLGLAARKVAYAYLSEKHADQVVNVVSLAGEIFSDYFMAQGIEALILGALVFVAMTIFSFPYALIISVLVALFALIPIFGAYIAGAIGFVLVLFSANFTKALSFVLLLILVQQFEGNVIYPRVVGGRVGLPPIWVFTAVTLGGKFFGFAGFLLGVPVTSIIYTLLKFRSELRIQKSDIDRSKIYQSPLTRVNNRKAVQEVQQPTKPSRMRKMFNWFREKWSKVTQDEDEDVKRDVAEGVDVGVEKDVKEGNDEGVEKDVKEGNDEGVEKDVKEGNDEDDDKANDRDDAGGDSSKSS